ncbi:MAG: TetR/AcrR family transcriptional regulator [Lachnospiraceae bacterium]|nr:TetR/AcrR family transcriptional regulator [Lachnospiraceae bacterium]
MARKPVLTGGKRDEILDAAMKLFFKNGYEATSVRMIVNEVGGEIGMFYHYFKSKDMLFDKVVERFFREYREKFEALLSACETREDFVKTFLPLYEKSMEDFDKLRGNIHWTVQIALHEGTLRELRPVVADLIQKWDVKNSESSDLLAGQLLYGISATIHSGDFEKLSDADKKECILDYIGRILDR